MARFRKDQRSKITRLPGLLAAFVLFALSNACAHAQALYDRPILIVDPDMHTAASFGAAADRAGSIVVTGSFDRTVRIWSAADGKLLRTIYAPAGPDYIGQLFAVAVSPDGKVIAAGGGGWENPIGSNLYLFDRNNGKVVKRIGLPGWNNGLAFSADGRYLAGWLRGSRLWRRS
jgi:WD40 repeat protein